MKNVHKFLIFLVALLGKIKIKRYVLLETKLYREKVFYFIGTVAYFIHSFIVKTTDSEDLFGTTEKDHKDGAENSTVFTLTNFLPNHFDDLSVGSLSVKFKVLTRERAMVHLGTNCASMP